MPSRTPGQKQPRQLISYVLPVYNEQDNIERLHQVLTETVAARPQFDYEFVYVNDGSRDSSLARLLDLQSTDDRMRVVDFSRNFGHQMAVTAGLDFADGDAVIIMDTDLQDPPAASLEMIDRWVEGFDVVYAQRRSRKDGLFKRMTAAAFYRTLRYLAEIDIPRDTGDFRLVNRAVVEAIKAMREQNRFIRGMVSFVGFRQTAVLFDRDERHAGATGYPLRKMLSFAADGIMGFSTAPLRVISRVGYVVSLLSLVGIIYALAVKLFSPATVIEGWTFTIISVLFIGGVQMVMTGVLGSYIARIYSEVQGRPLYLVNGLYGAKRVARGDHPPA
jgi:dolichol-phosphate mannosyltransferase